MDKKRIVIVGAGFAGLLTAKRLSLKLGEKGEVVLINQSPEFLFAPRLIDVLQDVERLPYRADLATLAKRYGYQFIQARVGKIDRTKKTVSYATANGDAQKISYDYLVLGPGATTNYYNTPGAKEFAIDLKTVDSITKIRERVVKVFADAVACNDEADCKRHLCFAVIGGGASGIEAMFALKVHVEAYAKRHAPDMQKFLSFILVQAAPQILPGFPDSMVDGAIALIHRQGVSLFIGEPVIQVTESGFNTAHGRMVPAGLVLWCAGLAAQPLDIEPVTAKDPAGFMLTDRSLRIDDSVFAAGDAITFRDKLVVVPKNGQTARLMAFAVVDNILRSINGQPLKHFHYFSKGTLLIVGKMGFLDLRLFVLRSRLIIRLRDILYRMIYTEIAT